jgi:hypothetical protein
MEAWLAATHAEEDYADLIAASTAIGFVAKSTLVASRLILLAAFVVRDRQHVTIALLPWQLVLTTLGLFRAVMARR